MGNPIQETVVTTKAIPDQQTHISEQELSAEEAGSRKPDHNIAAAVWTITCGVALPCIPVLIVSAVLLYIIFHYRIIPQPGWPELQILANETQGSESAISILQFVRHHGGHPAYYVRYNPSTITTIAAWTGRVIPYLSSSIMALVAFFAARRIVTKSKRGNGEDLLTPEQLTLLIGLLGGNGVAPLKDTLLHKWAKKERLVDPVPFAFYALLLVTSVGLLIPITDTWFGIATTPDIITQLYNGTTTSYSSFGRALSKTLCPTGPGSFSGFDGLEWLPCNLPYDDGDQYGIYPGLSGASEATALLEGLSKTTLIMNYTLEDESVVYFLADGNVDAKLDFKASTFAVSTQCKPISRQCLPGQTHPQLSSASINNNNLHFTCSPGFAANFSFNGAVQTIDASAEDGGANQSPNIPMVGLAFAPSTALESRVGEYVPNLSNKVINTVFKGGTAKYLVAPTQYVGTNWSYSYVLPRNPLHFVAWASGYPSGEYDNLPIIDLPPLLRDPQIYYENNFAYWILGCDATVYNVQYAWVNGSVHTFNATPSSAEMGGMVSGPFAFQLSQASTALSDAANLASLQTSSEALADVFALSWSKAAIALTTGGLEPARNEIEQLRNSTVAVARVPMIPLYLLLGFKALYVVAVIFLAIGAYCFTHPAETEIVKAQLSAKGLAAAHFDTPGLLQQNVVQELQHRLQANSEASPTATGGDHTPATVVQREEIEEQGTATGGGEKVKGSKTWPVDNSSTMALHKTPTQPAPAAAAKKVGLVAHADGAWRFAVVADGIWSSIKPVAVNLLELDAKDGGMGVAGEVVQAWT